MPSGTWTAPYGLSELGDCGRHAAEKGDNEQSGEQDQSDGYGEGDECDAADGSGPHVFFFGSIRLVRRSVRATADRYGPWGSFILLV